MKGFSVVEAALEKSVIPVKVTCFETQYVGKIYLCRSCPFLQGLSED